MTDRDVTRRGAAPDDGRIGRPDWWSAPAASAPAWPGPASAGSAAPPPFPAASGAGPAGQPDGWSTPATQRSPAYASPDAPPSAASTLGPSAPGGYGPIRGGMAAYGSGGPGSPGSGAPADAGPGSAGGWAPPRAGAYSGGAYADATVQGGQGWGPPPAATPAPPAGPPTVPQNLGWPPTPGPSPNSYPPAGGPGYGPPGAGYGAPPPGVGTVVRHRPGAGLVLGLIGAVALVLSLTALPWVEAGGQEVTFSDIREAYEHIDDRTSMPMAGGSLPSGPAVEPGLSSPSDVTDAAVNTGKNSYLEVYTAWGWIAVLAGVSLAILFVTLLVPSTRGGRMATGFLLFGLLGLLINVADDEGKVAPRVAGVLLTLCLAGLHVGALWALFGEDLAPDPAFGVWVGVAGLAAVLAGCVAGTRRERVAAGYR